MKGRGWQVTLAMLFVAAGTAAGAAPAPRSDSEFSDIAFADHDPSAVDSPPEAGHFRNPILPGFHPDPSIVKVGSDYFLVNSSFGFYPGLPIFHSRDLVHWQQIGNAIDRPGMVKLDGLGISRGLFAATIRHHGGRFYIINTCIDCGGNFIITAINPAGPWSNPVWLPWIAGIDPDLFIDDDGSAWVVNNDAPAHPAAYDGQRAIWQQQVDLVTLRPLGPRRLLVEGGVHVADKPIWIEGPHLIKRDGWYYLIAAEGGTASQHSETVYRSRNLDGPYVAGPLNPILTQRDLDAARPWPVAAAGHADFVKGPDGKWWAVFLATRPYDANLSNMGRETFLLPVDWPDGGWPVILPQGQPVPRLVPLPVANPRARGQTASLSATSPSGLTPDWIMLRTPHARWFRANAGKISLTPQTSLLGGNGNPSFLGKRQREANTALSATLHIGAGTAGRIAGLAVFADERHFLLVGQRRTASGTQIIAMRRNGNADLGGLIIAAAPFSAAAVRLRLQMRGPNCDLGYARVGGAWQWLLTGIDCRMLASEPTNQFTGTVLGVYAGQLP